MASSSDVVRVIGVSFLLAESAPLVGLVKARGGDSPTPCVLVGLSGDCVPDVEARFVEAPDPAEGDRIDLVPLAVETAEDGVLLSTVQRKAVVEKERVRSIGELKTGAQAPDIPDQFFRQLFDR